MTKTINAEVAIHVDGVGKYFGFENAFIVAYKEGIAVGLLPNKTAIKE